LILVSHELHELVHTATGRVICGAWGARDFNVWQLAPGCESWVPTLVGPVFSWTVMWIGVALLGSAVERRRWAGLALIFAPNPLGRLLPALMGGGDEGVVARTLLGSAGPWARVAVAVAAALIVVPSLVIAWRALPTAKRPLWFGLLFIGGILVTGPLFFVLGNGLLSRGVLAGPGLWGAPQLVDLFMAVTLALSIVFWRGIWNEGRSPTG
jgi:hypothetical protein